MSSIHVVEESRFRTSVKYALGFIAVMWFIKLAEWLLSADFGIYGIYPRTLTGTVGILLSPLIHGDFTHLFSNTFPMVVLGIGVMFFYRRVAVDVFFLIYLLTGIAVWFFARQAYHIGASGIIYGLVSFLFFSGLIRKDLKSVTVSLVVLFMYSGMLQGIFPTTYGISWESHLMGSVVGFGCAVAFRNVPLSVDDDLKSESHAGDPVNPVDFTVLPGPNAPTINYDFKEKSPVPPQDPTKTPPRKTYTSRHFY